MLCHRPRRQRAFTGCGGVSASAGWWYRGCTRPGTARVGRETGDVSGGVPDPALPPELPAHTVAVLPFQSLGSKCLRLIQNLASELADNVLHALADNPQITVVARRPSFAVNQTKQVISVRSDAG